MVILTEFLGFGEIDQSKMVDQDSGSSEIMT